MKVFNAFNVDEFLTTIFLIQSKHYSCFLLVLVSNLTCCTNVPRTHHAFF